MAAVSYTPSSIYPFSPVILRSRLNSPQTYEFSVAMTCSGCSGTVERVLAKLGTAITKVDIDLDNKLVFVTSSELAGEQILETIKKTGLDSKLNGLKQ